MVEATQSLPLYPSAVIACLVRNAAKTAVKKSIQDQGRSTSTIYRRTSP